MLIKMCVRACVRACSPYSVCCWLYTHTHTYLHTGEDAALFVVEGYLQCHALLSSSRHRMTEREEDEELLLGEKDDIEESSNITHFSESPYCESVRGGEGRGWDGRVLVD